MCRFSDPTLIEVLLLVNFGSVEGVSGITTNVPAPIDSALLSLGSTCLVCLCVCSLALAKLLPCLASHSQRLEQKYGNRLNIVGIVDPAVERTASVLETKRATIAAGAYANTQIFRDVPAAAEALGQDGAHAIIVGCPPAFRGHADPSSGKDVELQLVKSFPRAGLLIEKPISAGTVDEAKTVGEQLSRTGNLVSVGYMLRYSKAVQKMKEIIVENKLEVMMTSARYVMGESNDPEVGSTFD